MFSLGFTFISWLSLYGAMFGIAPQLHNLTLILLNRLSLPRPFLTVNQSENLISWLISHLIWIYTVFKGNAYPGSAGQGLISWTWKLYFNSFAYCFKKHDASLMWSLYVFLVILQLFQREQIERPVLDTRTSQTFVSTTKLNLPTSKDYSYDSCLNCKRCQISL